MSKSPLILYVEDNPDNRKLVRRILLAHGFKFHGLANAKETFKFLEAQIPDLILMDINLPEIDGYAMTKQLRKQTDLAQTPIIALTASVMKADKEKATEAGCNGFIQKPINVDLLPKQITDYLNRK